MAPSSQLGRALDLPPGIPEGTTAAQALDLAPWPAWWIGLVLAVLGLSVLHRRAVRREERGTGWTCGLLVAAAVQLFAGTSTLFAMLMVSAGGGRWSPWWFVAVWLVFCAAMSALFLGTVRASHHSGDP